MFIDITKQTYITLPCGQAADTTFGYIYMYIYLLPPGLTLLYAPGLELLYYYIVYMKIYFIFFNILYISFNHYTKSIYTEINYTLEVEGRDIVINSSSINDNPTPTVKLLEIQLLQANQIQFPDFYFSYNFHCFYFLFSPIPILLGTP